MTTPQRALELANGIEQVGGGLCVRASEFNRTVSIIRCAIDDGFDEIAAILRHYAEIMQAEPVATVEDGELYINGSWCGFVSAIVGDCELIIKPEPLK